MRRGEEVGEKERGRWVEESVRREEERGEKGGRARKSRIGREMI